MFHLNASIDYRDGSGTVVPITVGIDRHGGDFRSARNHLAAERAIDDVLADSFPASDPPGWNAGVARPGVATGASDDVTPAEPRTERTHGERTSAAGVVDVSTPRIEQTYVQGLISAAGVVGLALLLPFAILIVGLPVALAVRALLEAVGWLFGVDMR